MDQPVFGRLVDSVFTSLKTSGTSANIGKFVEFFLSNPAKSIHIAASTCGFVQHGMEQKTSFRNLAKTTAAFNPAGIPVLLDVAGRNNE
jgi:hypothetical protein